MSHRLLTLIALAAGAVALSGCVVAPAYPGYGYGYGRPVVRVVPPPVVVVPPPRHRHWHDDQDDGGR
jgi:hypothetical protein